jgi:hypothetical protein
VYRDLLYQRPLAPTNTRLFQRLPARRHTLVDHEGLHVNRKPREVVDNVERSKSAAIGRPRGPDVAPVARSTGGGRLK